MSLTFFKWIQYLERKEITKIKIGADHLFTSPEFAAKGVVPKKGEGLPKKSKGKRATKVKINADHFFYFT